MSDTEQMRQPERQGSAEPLSTAAIAGTQPRPAPEEASFAPAGRSADGAPLLAQEEAADLREKWSAIQAGFVDEPRRSVEGADGLVALTMKRMADVFAEERANMEHQWDRGDQVSTEELRLALQRYRSFFDRLLAF
jgi:hypothetical protein